MHIYEFAIAAIFPTNPILEEGQMLKGFEEFQKAGKDNFDAAVRSFGEVNKGFQAIAAEVTDYSKKAFEDSTRAFEQLVGAKSIEQAIEIQSQYAKKAYDTYMAEMSKISEMYVGMAKDAYKPVEAAFTKKAA
jgi:phasin family protein